MAFDFLGTFNKEDFEKLFVFAENQLADIEGKISYLRAKIERIGWVEFHLNVEGEMTSYTVSPENSQIAKYIRTYQFYGGSMLDLPILSRGQWLFLTKGEASLNVDSFQGGKVEGADYDPNIHKDDSVEAIVMTKMKDWITPAIIAKREEWEFRIKKSVDEADQCLEDIILLVKRSTGAETIHDLKTQIEYFLSSDEFVGAGKKSRIRN